MAALAYPMIVLVVGAGVLVFLSTRTLPELAGVLAEAGLEVPALTSAVMAAGQAFRRMMPWLLIVTPLAPTILLLWLAGAARLGLGGVSPTWWMIPLVVRRAAVAEFLLGFAELLRTGVPAVDALRVIAPASGGGLTGELRRQVLDAADRVERGEPLACALSDRRWFPPEVGRLVGIGQQSGELEPVLDRLGQRYRRSARRLVDRMAALLEPIAILLLAVGVGIVVMAAILPLIRLQQMI